MCIIEVFGLGACNHSEVLSSHVCAEAFGCIEGALIAALHLHACVQAKTSVYVCKWAAACQGAGSRFAFDCVVRAETFVPAVAPFHKVRIIAPMVELDCGFLFLLASKTSLRLSRSRGVRR